MPSKMRALRRGSALTRAERKEFGPVQIMVVGFDDLKFQGDILPELRRLRDLQIVRLVDMVIVAKSDGGDFVEVHASDLTEKESAQVAGIAEVLVGIGAAEEGIEPVARPGVEISDVRGYVGDERTWSVAEVIPPGRMAVVALLEHRWAFPLRDATLRAGGATLADDWIYPDDLALYAAIAKARQTGSHAQG
jgi:hypothetical protein